jgi:hypothetical protein
MKIKRISKQRKLFIQAQLKRDTYKLEAFFFKNLTVIKELQDLTEHRNFCVNSVALLSAQEQTNLNQKGFDFLTTSNFVLESAKLYKKICDNPQELILLYKKVNKGHLLLNENIPPKITAAFQDILQKLKFLVLDAKHNQMLLDIYIYQKKQLSINK